MMLYARIEEAYLASDYQFYDEAFLKDDNDLLEFIEDSSFEDFWGEHLEEFDMSDFKAGFSKELETGGDWDDPAYAKITFYSLDERVKELQIEKSIVMMELEKAVVLRDNEKESKND